MGVGRSVIGLALGLGLGLGGARADVTVDWGKGLVIAQGVGVADRHAPNPSVARGTSRRGAEDVAKKQIAARLDDLPLAGGGKVGDKTDKTTKARLAAAVDAAIALDGEPETDGAWRVTMAVPIEAVRQALVGARKLGDHGDGGPPVIVVEGAGAAKPAVGYTINGEPSAMIWVKTVPAWAKSAPHATAKKIHGSAIDVPGITATAATLFVITP